MFREPKDRQTDMLSVTGKLLIPRVLASQFLTRIYSEILHVNQCKRGCRSHWEPERRCCECAQGCAELVRVTVNTAIAVASPTAGSGRKTVFDQHSLTIQLSARFTDLFILL